MNRVFADLRLAFRQAGRTPGFTTVAIAVLALGIGATTALFTVLDDVVLRPLPYDDAERLVYIDTEMPGEGSDTNWGVSEAAYFFLRDGSRSFEEIGAYGGAESGHELTVVGEEGGARVSAAYVTASLLEVLRAAPALGRLILEEDDGWMGPDGSGVLSTAVLGHDFWLREYGGDPGVIGSTLRLEGELGVEVVGVMEPGLNMPHSRVDLWLPLGLHPARAPEAFHGYRIVGRLTEGVTLDDAASELSFLTAQLPGAFPEVYSERFIRESGYRTRATPLRARVLGGLDEVLWLLFGSVSLLLLIAYANVTNIFLVRADVRQRDRAIRRAMGAGRIELARQIVSETLLLSLIAAAAGLWLADGFLRTFLAVAPDSLPRLENVSLGGSSLLAALGGSFVAGLALSCALIVTGSSDLKALRDGGVRTTMSKSRQRARRIMIVTQMALSLVLLAGAGLLFRSFEQLRDVDPGLDPSELLIVDLYPPATRRYIQPTEVQQLYREITARVGAIPGVREVSAGGVPLADDPTCLAAFTEDRPLEPGEQPPCINQSTVAPGFFQAMGIPLRGREPIWADAEGELWPWAGGEVVVTRALAARLWPDQDPIGKGIRLREAGVPYARVVGVTGDLYGDGLDRPPAEHVFGQLWSRSNSLVVKLDGIAPESVAAPIRSAIRELDPAVAIGRMRSMEEVIASSPFITRTSLTLLLLGVGATMGLLLSAVGLFGVLAYIVRQRRTEIGIRRALGAPRGQVAASVVGDSIRLAVAGAGFGILGAIPASWLLRSLLFQVSPGDPTVLTTATLVLVLVVLAASWLPARGAARVDPMVAMRAD